MYNKELIDKEAEQEAIAIRKQGRGANSNFRRLKLEDNYNQKIFDKLFTRK